MITKEYLIKNIKEGWRLNPNEKVVEGVLKGINRCDGECPCNNNSTDKRCPCSNYRENDYCCCKLYVKK
jgi:ferredoxin-thioredoxin reductase catalytic subunit